MRRRVEEGVCEVDCVNPTHVKRANTALPPAAFLRKTASALKALTHEGRLRILWALEDRELCVCDLAQVLGLSFSGTSQQLKTLRELGAIDYRTEGKLVYYTLTDPFWLKLARSAAEYLGLEEKRVRTKQARRKKLA